LKKSIENGDLLIEDTKSVIDDYELKTKKKIDEQRAILREAGFEITTITVRNFGVKNKEIN
jgi:hypothetical protein